MMCFSSSILLNLLSLLSITDSFLLQQHQSLTGLKSYQHSSSTSKPTASTSSIITASSLSLSAKLHAVSDESESDSNTSSSTTRRDFFVATTTAAATTVTSASPKLWLPGGIGGNANAADTTTTVTPKPAIELPPIGLGAWAWGDSLFWGYDPKNDDQLRQVYDYATSRKKGRVLFDTAEVYGLGTSEKLLGKFSNNDSDEVLIATKFAAVPFRTKSSDVIKACQESMKRLGGRKIDLYQIHFPNAWSNAAYWDGLADCYHQGLVKAVGVSNYGVDATIACYNALAKRDVPLSTNQIQLSLLYRHPLTNGLLDTCNKLNVKVLSYSPLALGYLTGKYDSVSNLPSGPRSVVGKRLFQDDSFQNLLNVMKDIAKNHGTETTLSQVALNWAISKGTIPIPGARTISQVTQNYGVLDWKLTKDEEQLLDEMSSKVTTYTQPESNPFPKEDVFTKLKMYDS